MALDSSKHCRWISAGVDLHGLLQDSSFPKVFTTGCLGTISAQLPAASRVLAVLCPSELPMLTCTGPDVTWCPVDPWCPCPTRLMLPLAMPQPIRQCHSCSSYLTGHRVGMGQARWGDGADPDPQSLPLALSKARPALPSTRCGFPLIPHVPTSSPQSCPALKSQG